LADSPRFDWYPIVIRLIINAMIVQCLNIIIIIGILVGEALVALFNRSLIAFVNWRFDSTNINFILCWIIRLADLKRAYRIIYLNHFYLRFWKWDYRISVFSKMITLLFISFHWGWSIYYDYWFLNKQLILFWLLSIYISYYNFRISHCLVLRLVFFNF
jgi:hypothetical protein